MTIINGLVAFIRRRPLFSLALFVLIGLAGGPLLRQAREGGQQMVGHTLAAALVLNDAETPRLDRPGADVTIVLFTDYACPICRVSEPELEAVIAADRGVRLLYKDWPILGAGSMAAARAALAADRQGRYVAMHRALMRAPARLGAEDIRRAAAGAGVDWDRLQQDLSRHGADIDRRLAKNGEQAATLGLRGTPAFVVGPYLIPGGVDRRVLTTAIADARRRQAAIS